MEKNEHRSEKKIRNLFFQTKQKMQSNKASFES